MRGLHEVLEKNSENLEGWEEADYSQPRREVITGGVQTLHVFNITILFSYLLI